MIRHAHDRLSVVMCPPDFEPNCRHAWNREHPDDPVTEEHQREFEDGILDALANPTP